MRGSTAFSIAGSCDQRSRDLVVRPRSEVLFDEVNCVIVSDPLGHGRAIRWMGCTSPTSYHEAMRISLADCASLPGADSENSTKLVRFRGRITSDAGRGRGAQACA